MSADNAVWVAQFTDGYRVSTKGSMSLLGYLFSPDDICPPEKKRSTIAWMFGESENYTLKGEALEEACRIIEDLDVCEYGIQVISFTFPYPEDAEPLQ